MALIDFPSTPLSPGTAHSQGGLTWRWDGAKWVAAGASDMAPGGRLMFFDDYPGVVGDGVHNDTVGMQAAITANAGGAIHATPGKTYLVHASLYLPTGTRCIGNGATLTWPSSGVYIRGAFVVGLAGVPAGDELAASDVLIDGWRFVSPAAEAVLPFAITCQPGCQRVRIANNHFTNTNPSTTIDMFGIYLDRRRCRDIVVDHNTYHRVERLIYVRGTEIFSGTIYHYNVLGPTNVQPVRPATNLPAAPGTTYFIVPDTPPPGETISPRARMKPPYNWPWGMTVTHRGQASESFRMYGPANGGNDMSFNNVDTVTIGAHIGELPTVVDSFTRFFVWNPAIEPGNDLNGLAITNNSGNYSSSTPIAIFCQIEAFRKGGEAGTDGLRNVVVDNNRLEFTNLPGGNVSNLFVSDDDGKRTTNYALYSEDFTNAVWVRTGIGTPGARVPGPRYDTSRLMGTQLFEASGSGVHQISQSLTLLNTGDWTASMFLKAVNRSTARAIWETAAGVGGYVDVDLAVGTIVGNGATGGGTLNFFGIIPYGDGWWRVYLDVSFPSSTAARYTLAITNGTGVTSYAGDPGFLIQAFGLQIEDQIPEGNVYNQRNSSPSKYKPTLQFPIYEVQSTAIAVNGTVNFQITNNVISSSPGQGIHIEDGATNGVIANNVLSECISGINVMTCRNVVIADNTVNRFYSQAIMVRGVDPAGRDFDPSKWVQFTGSITGTTLTVTAISNYPQLNLLLNAEGDGKTLTSPGWIDGEVKPRTRIVSQLTGTAGGIGTYQVSISHPGVTSREMEAGFGVQVVGVDVRGNHLDADNLPSAQWGVYLEAGDEPFRITLEQPPTLNLPQGPGAPAVDVFYQHDCSQRISAESWPRPLPVSQLGAAATKTGQRRFVSDALAPAWGATVVGGGTVPVGVISDGTNWVVR